VGVVGGPERSARRRSRYAPSVKGKRFMCEKGTRKRRKLGLKRAWGGQGNIEREKRNGEKQVK